MNGLVEKACSFSGMGLIYLSLFLFYTLYLEFNKKLQGWGGRSEARENKPQGKVINKARLKDDMEY